jgi:exonuclease III
MGAKKRNPQKYFHRNLNEFIGIAKTCKGHIILIGDFNEPMNKQSSMARIASKQGLLDMLFQQNSQSPEPNRYACGSTRIDYALISPKLTATVKSCGFESFQQKIKIQPSRNVYRLQHTTVVQKYYPLAWPSRPSQLYSKKPSE